MSNAIIINRKKDGSMYSFAHYRYLCKTAPIQPLFVFNYIRKKMLIKSDVSATHSCVVLRGKVSGTRLMLIPLQVTITFWLVTWHEHRGSHVRQTVKNVNKWHTTRHRNISAMLLLVWWITNIVCHIGCRVWEPVSVSSTIYIRTGNDSSNRNAGRHEMTNIR